MLLALLHLTRTLWHSTNLTQTWPASPPLSLLPTRYVPTSSPTRRSCDDCVPTETQPSLSPLQALFAAKTAKGTSIPQVGKLVGLDTAPISFCSSDEREHILTSLLSDCQDSRLIRSLLASEGTRSMLQRSFTVKCVELSGLLETFS